MFVGTLRYNLDPFEKHTDDEIWTALEISGLKAKIQSLDVCFSPIIQLLLECRRSELDVGGMDDREFPDHLIPIE